MKLIILILLLQNQVQGRLLSYERTHGNRFVCEFVTMKNDTLRGLKWSVPGLKRYTPEIGVWHTIQYLPGHRVQIKKNK